MHRCHGNIYLNESMFAGVSEGSSFSKQKKDLKSINKTNFQSKIRRQFCDAALLEFSFYPEFETNGSVLTTYLQ